jgi:hypothetical protein
MLIEELVDARPEHDGGEGGWRCHAQMPGQLPIRGND